MLCALGAIPPNGVIGLRTNTSLRSRRAWRSIHRRAIAPLVMTTTMVAVCWLLYPAGFVNSQASAGLGLIILVAGILWAWAYSQRSARTH
ncbi:SdpI family protein [Leifsonia sp. A12D58]|uniref:SdpI family protein n=1 Tax=Leifsonia sp. A12D58 TaxID=3397674 RepID=UPI0039E112FC